jgi:pantothenate kinase
MEPSRTLIGIAGAPGVGKSTFAEQFAASLRADGVPAVVVGMDGFHLSQAELVRLGRRDRMGAPDTFDLTGFLSALRVLRDARLPAALPVFDRHVEEARPKALKVGPEIRTVVVEGNYLLHDADGWEEVLPLLDSVIFLEAAPKLRLDRLIRRHVEYGKTPDEAREWALGPDERNAELIARGRERASMLVTVD